MSFVGGYYQGVDGEESRKGRFDGGCVFVVYSVAAGTERAGGVGRAGARAVRRRAAAPPPACLPRRRRQGAARARAGGEQQCRAAPLILLSLLQVFEICFISQTSIV